MTYFKKLNLIRNKKRPIIKYVIALFALIYLINFLNSLSEQIL